MVKKQQVEDTGERMVPELHKGTFIYGEHMARYEAAVSITEDLTVLDIACGSGYGSKMLSEKAKKVYGVDIDQEALEYAKEKFSAKNVEYIKGDGVSIPLKSSSVDVIVSFETIEHIEDYETFLKECKRVLKKDGLFILSTPNDKEFSEGNHFHVHEFEYKELIKTVSKEFVHIKPYFQGSWVCNALLDESEISHEWTKEKSVTNLSPKPVERVIYFFLLISNRKIEEKIHASVTLSEHWSRREIEEEHQLTRNHHINLNQLIEKLNIAIQDKDKAIESLQNEIARLQLEATREKSKFPYKTARKIRRNINSLRSKDDK